MVYIAVLGYPASAILLPWVVPTAFYFVHRPCVEQTEGLQGECGDIVRAAWGGSDALFSIYPSVGRLAVRVYFSAVHAFAARNRPQDGRHTSSDLSMCAVSGHPKRSEGKPRRSALRAVLRGAVRETVGCADYAPLAACTSFPYALRMFASPLAAARRQRARVVHKSGIVFL